MFTPTFTITPAMAQSLMSLEADRQLLGVLPLSVSLLDSLRRSARLLSTHLSTQIEGNRLSQKQVQAVVEGEGNFPGRERDEAEVRHYFAALEYVEKLASQKTRLTEKELRTLHGIVMTGKPKPTPYRDGQNVIRDARTGAIVYLPPEAKDVPGLMKELVTWIVRESQNRELPAPILAGLAHYQFATIHPYFDGNGRTARLLTNLILHRLGYGLQGIYCLEEYYAANLPGYYTALSTGPSHNYYFGRAEADLTPFVAYFCDGMATAFARIRVRAESADQAPDETKRLQELTVQQRRILGLFLKQAEITKGDVAKFFKLPPRQAYLLCAKWLREGFLVVGHPATKTRTYRLAETYHSLLNSPRR
jgi:Fic family protein